MKAYTDMEREVMLLSNNLTPFNAFDTEAYEEFELSCDDDISDNYSWDHTCNGVSYIGQLYITVLDKVKEYQVVRTFLCQIRERINRMFCQHIQSEVVQTWFSKSGERVVLARDQGWMRDGVAGRNYDAWRPNTPLRIRRNKDYSFVIDNGCRYFMDSKVIFINGMADFFYRDIAPMFHNCGLFALSYRGEFLMKNGYKKLFYSICNGKDEDPEMYFDTLKVAHRHHYRFDKHYKTYMKLLRLIEYCGGDLHNPKFVCPENLRQACHYWLCRKKDIDRRNCIAANLEYGENMGPLLEIAFQNEHYRFHVLKSVSEFKKEGKAMHHCVYKNKYYKKPNLLIFSVTDLSSGKRVSTASVMLRQMRVDQHYLKNDAVPPKELDIEVRQEIKKHFPEIIEARDRRDEMRNNIIERKLHRIAI